MHDLSIAGSIIDLAVEEAKKRNSPAVVTIKLRLGEFTGVVGEALEFGLKSPSEGHSPKKRRWRSKLCP